MSSLRSAARLLVLALSLVLAGSGACTRSSPDTTAPPEQTPSAARTDPAEHKVVIAGTGVTKTDPARQPGAAGPAADEDAVEPSGDGAGAWKTAVEPKALSPSVDEGLSWLVAHQLPSGGWGQGDESPQMRGSTPQALRDTANVADTAMAVLALMRAGSTPRAGAHAEPVRRGIGFILSEIEASDAESLFVTSIRGTRVQGKIGTYVDTFTGLIALTEAKGQMPDAKGNARLDAALAKVLSKIEKNQRQDGTWGNQGWAPVLTQSMAAKGLNRAAQAGERVDEDTLKRVEEQAQSQFDARSGTFRAAGSAGVGLYAGAANSASMRDSVTTRKSKEGALRKQLAAAESEDERRVVRQELAENEAATQAAEKAEEALLARLDDPAFIQGFGNNGGEEFLSYMLVSEALVAKGGEDWKQWDAKITKLVNRVQNGDGSWTGHHCITGRTFCTAAALLVLMADRTPVPVASQIQHG